MSDPIVLPTHPRFKNLTGQQFGRLTVLIYVAMTRRGAEWLCRCSCQNTLKVLTVSLRSGNTTSCGCITRERLIAQNSTHGLTDTAEYTAWAHMLGRCYRPTDEHYDRYGGRGITVCERWHSFENFYADMGPKPSPLHEIDRIDNDGNYEPGNVRWATKQQQSRNRSTNRIIEFGGRKLTLIEWSEISGVNRKTISDRLDAGWPTEKALTQPPRTRQGANT
jgi:hypothetical protein